MKDTKGQNGITLIALVITIVVLLILAAITITFVLSDGGIFKQARNAKWEQEAAAIRDYTLSGQTALGLEYFNPKYKENGAGKDAPSRESIKKDEIMEKSFPSDIYTLGFIKHIKYSDTPYSSKIAECVFKVTTTKAPDMTFFVVIEDGIVRVLRYDSSTMVWN